jgi:hypothetical protein
VDEGCVDNAIRSGCSAAQTLKVIQRAEMHLSARGGQRLGAFLRTSKTENLMARVDQFSDNCGTDKACCTCHEYSHIKAPFLFLSILFTD